MSQIFSPRFIFCSAVILVVFTLIMPVSATFQVQQSLLNPSAILLKPGTQQSVTAIIAIIPQGATTFIEGNQLQLTTDLAAPRWDVQVMVNGIPAAVIPVRGNTAFINGFLLSYPNNEDVSVSASVTGNVPDGVPAVNLLQVLQLNNAGQVIPGAVQTITEPVAMSPTPVLTTHPVSVSPTATITTPVPTRASGLIPTILIAGLVIGVLAALKVKLENEPV